MKLIRIFKLHGIVQPHNPCRYILLTILFSVTSIIAPACKSSKVQKPEASYKQAYQASPSFINIPVSMSESELENKINQQFKGLIYEDNNMEDDNLAVKAWKKSDVDVELQGTQMKYTVPLKLWIKTGLKMEKFGVNLSSGFKEVEGEIALHFVTDFSIDENWEFKTTTTSDGYQWLKTPKVNLGPVQLPITFIADRLMASNTDYLSQEIDRQIASQFDLKTYMQDFWQNMQQPVLLSEEYPLWLVVKPKKILMTPFENNLGQLTSTIGVEAMSEVVMGKKPKLDITDELPPFEMHLYVDDLFEINIVADIPYSEAQTLVNSYIQGKTFTSGKRKVTVSDVEMYGKDDDLIISTEVKGDINGKLYLTGKPSYNPKTATIEITNLDFELETKNFLHKTAAWMFKSKFKRSLEPYLKFPLQENIEDVKKQVQDSLNNNEIFHGVVVNGNLDKMEIETVMLNPESMKVVVVSKGKMRVNISGLN